MIDLDALEETRKIAVFDADGHFLAKNTVAYARAAIDRGELEWRDGHLHVIPQPIRELTPAEKIAAHRKKEAKKTRR